MGSSSQSPQTGQVYFNPVLATESTIIGQDVSQSPQTGQVYFNIWNIQNINVAMDFSSQSPQTGQVYFNMAAYNDEPQPVYVTIPSNGSSLFQSCILEFMTNTKLYRHNPLKRVKFISILSLTNGMEGLVKSHNPLKRVKFISIIKE